MDGFVLGQQLNEEGSNLILNGNGTALGFVCYDMPWDANQFIRQWVLDTAGYGWV